MCVCVFIVVVVVGGGGGGYHPRNHISNTPHADPNNELSGQL